MMDPVSLFFTIIHTLATFVGCTLNAIVLYLAIFRTPKAIAAYTTILINFATTDLLACFTDFFIQMRHIPAGFTVAYTSRALCTRVGPHFCFFMYSVNISLIAHGLWSLLFGFCYRYYILFHPAPPRKTLIIALLIIYIPSFVQMWLFLLADDDPVHVKRILMERFPEYELENSTVYGTINIIQFPVMYTIVHMTCPITPVYIAIWILRKKIIRKLMANTTDMSSKTKEMHQQLLKALTWQTLIPSFYCISIASYVMAQFFYHHPIFEYTTLTGFVVMPVLSPLSCLIFIQIFKKRVLSWWYIIIGKPIPEKWRSVLYTSKVRTTNVTGAQPSEIKSSNK